MVPEWEKACDFNPEEAMSQRKRSIHWVTLKGTSGEGPQPPPGAVHFEKVLQDQSLINFDKLFLRDPEHFVAGELHNHVPDWNFLLQALDGSSLPCSEILGWLKHGVDVKDFFQHFKGTFKGEFFDSDEPPVRYFNNSPSCRQFASFVASQLENNIRNGAISLVGRVGECEMPKLIMPLTVEPTKPRLCHDERFLNCWIRDSPFRMENLRDLHRLVAPGARMISCDEKSGYNHVRLKSETPSDSYFGLQFGGYVMIYNTLPFGWKASAFVYQTIGMVPTTYLRQFGFATTQYIDDRFAVEVINRVSKEITISIDVTKYALLELLTRLGYFLALIKSFLDGVCSLKHLGFIVDSVRQAYLLPPEKRNSFAALRDQILSGTEVDVRTLQRFAGKCVSMVLVVPAAKLYTREVNRAISLGLKQKAAIKMYPALTEEISHWKFLDTWDGHMSWNPECHKQVSLATDASPFKYGAVFFSGQSKPLSFSDFWAPNDNRPIHLKEANALLCSLQALLPTIRNYRVDVLSDSKCLVDVWNNQGGKDAKLTDIVKNIFQLVFSANINLQISYIPSSLNPADKPSRELSSAHVSLSDNAWFEVEREFGPHSIDLMALDSNAMKGADGIPLRHFTPTPSPRTAGVNFFAQEIDSSENPYIFPPDFLILPVLNYLLELGVHSCTVILPGISGGPIWAPLVKMYSKSSLLLGVKGQKGVLRMPSKRGFILDQKGLKAPLWAHRMAFS